MSKASNAVLALSRAYYGKRLREKQYTDLLSCRDLNEIAAYLRNETCYKDVLKDAPDIDFTARILEGYVERYKYENYKSLARFESAAGNEYYKYFKARTETEQILKCTLFMIGGNRKAYLIDMFSFLDMHLGIDLYRLGRAESLEDIADALKGTPYEKIYRGCLSAEEINYLNFELAFDDYLAKYQYQLCKKSFRGKEQKGMHEAVSRCLDVQYILKQLRIADYYDGVFAVSGLVLPQNAEFSLFTDAQLKRLTKARGRKEILEILLKSPYKKYVEINGVPGTTQKNLYRGLYDYFKKTVRFSTEPGVVMYSYLFLSQNETRNIVRIIEGKRYGLEEEEIRTALVGEGE